MSTPELKWDHRQRLKESTMTQHLYQALALLGYGLAGIA